MVYFIQAGGKDGPIKIGKTEDFRHRLSGLQTASPDKLTVLGLLPDEPDDAPYHTQFRSSHKRGEWFRPSADLLKFIKGLPPFTIPKKPRQPRTTYITNPPKSEVEVRCEFAAQVFQQIPFTKPGSPARLSYMKLYAKLRGWKSWKDVPAFSQFLPPDEKPQNPLKGFDPNRPFERRPPTWAAGHRELPAGLLPPTVISENQYAN